MSDYILYTDRKENFSCDIALEGARLSDSFARIILETKDVDYVFKGSINVDGKCEIPIRALKGLLDVNDGGNMVLEVVADDTYFRPWESTFSVDAHTKLEVKINEQAKPAKPKISVAINTKKVETPQPKKLTLSEHKKDIHNILHKNKINKKNFTKNKPKAQKLFTEYFTDNKISDKGIKNKILKEVVESIIKG